MKKETINTLLKKYLEGNSSLSEEAKLFEHNEQIDDEIGSWIKYVNKEKVTISDNFNDQQWDIFEQKTTKNNRLIYRITGIAASILLIISVFMSKEKNMSLEQKRALLTEAKNMFSEINPIDDTIDENSIIFENNNLVIYTSNE